MRARDQNGDLAHRRRQRRLCHHRLCQFPDRLAELRFVNPRIPRPEQRTVVPDIDEALKIPGDPLPHIVIKRFLFGIQVRGRNDWQRDVTISNGGPGLREMSVIRRHDMAIQPNAVRFSRHVVRHVARIRRWETARTAAPTAATAAPARGARV